MSEGVPLPEYRVRHSTRARHVRLTVSPRDGLVVTLPRGVPVAAAERAVRDRAEWARRHLERTAARRSELAAPPENQLPWVVELRAFSETWPVEYRETASARVSARVNGGVVVVSGAIGDADACLGALRRWRNRIAAERLPALLDEVSGAVGIAFTAVGVRGQRTRWGSCSSAGRISLNRNLVFLPEHLVRYVLAHELAHVHRLHHGPEFWALLETLVPESDRYRRQLKGAGALVPAWAHD